MFQVSFSLQAFQPKFWKHFSSFPRVLHTSPISSHLDLITLTIFGEEYNYGAPHYTIFPASRRFNPLDDDQWRYSPDQALASLYGFHDSLYSTMWGYQLHDRPVLDTLIQPSETSSSNYQRLSRRSRETRMRNGRWILPTNTYRARRGFNPLTSKYSP
jgi:hypothetical protein